MSSSIKLTNSSGKIVTITNPDTTSADVTVDLLNNAYTIATVDDFGTVPVGYTTVIVKDTDRGGVFVWSASGTANGGTVFAGSSGYWVRQYSGAVNVKWFGAVGDGVTDDTAAIQAAIDSGSKIVFPSGIYLCGAVDLPSSDIEILGAGGTLQGTSGTYIFKQVDRNHLFKCTDLIFTGNAKAFFYDSDEASLPNNGQHYEFYINGCQFLQSGSVIAIHLYGSREGVITGCYFEGNDGVRVEAGSINTKITDCHFKNCNYGVYSLLTSSVGNAEGIIVSGAVMLGCSYGIRADRTTGVQVSNCMIDYCDSPIYLQGAESVIISGNYISTRTSIPAIYSAIYGAYRGSNHIVSGNIVVDNYSTTGSSCIRYENTDFVTLSDNTLTNYASYGFVIDNCTQVNVHDNITRNRSGLGTNSLLTLTDDSTVNVYHNRFTQTINRTHYISTWRNSGVITENSGEAIITTGNSSVTFSHGLSFTPSKLLVTLTPTTPNTDSLSYYVSNITSTQITITLTAAVASTTAFAWTVKSRA